MRTIGRLLMILAVLLPVGVVASAAANGAVQGFGPAVLKCMHFKDGMAISPGLTNTPANQTVKAHGRMYGCNKAGGSAVFSADMHMTNATCSDLSMSGTNRFAWANGDSSTALLSYKAQAVEPTKIFITGLMVSGRFKGLVVTAWIRFTPAFKGTGKGCSATNPLRHIDFTNTQSYQLQKPAPETSTLPPRSTTSVPKTTTTHATLPATTSTSSSSSTTTPTTHASTSSVPVSVAGSTNAPTTAAAAAGKTTSSTADPNAVVAKGTGALAFTGSSSLGGIVGLESLIVGGGLACFGRDRRNRRGKQQPRGARSWLRVTLPPSS